MLDKYATLIKIENGYIMDQKIGESKVTIDHVASYCGFSKATVSRVINKEGSVKPATEAKELEAIEKLGYMPNNAASPLSGGKTGTIAVFLPDVKTEYYAALLTGLEEVAEKQFFNIIIKTQNNKKALLDLAINNKVDAFVLRNNGLQPFDHDVLVTLKRRGIPVVFIGKPPAESDSHAILIDNVGGARLMAHHYVQHGFKKILFIAGPEDTLDSNDRLYGFKIGLSELSAEIERLDVIHGDFLRESGYLAAQEALRNSTYDAIFAASDHMALGAMLYCRSRGIRVPGDMAITGFDDTFFSEFLDPPLTTVRQPMQDIGSIAMETVLRILEHHESRFQKIILPTQLQIRQSCGCTHA
jgi:DNA-binding LacI/PurR family transcriptional regulator